MLEITMISLGCFFGFVIGMILLLVGIYFDPVRFYNNTLKEWIEIRSGGKPDYIIVGDEEAKEKITSTIEDWAIAEDIEDDPPLEY